MRAIHAEWLKLTTTRTTWVILGIGVAFGLLQASLLLFVVPETVPGVTITDPAGVAVDALAGNSIWVLVVGLLAVTTEFRHETAGRTFMSEPSRLIVVGAKLAVVTGLAAAWAVAVAVTMLVPVFLSGDVTFGAGTAADFGWALLTLAMTALLGAALGALLRSQVLALVATLVWVFVVENLAAAFVPDVGKWLPFQVLQRAFIPEGADAAGGGFEIDPLSTEVAVAVFFVYVAVAVSGGVWLLTRRDV